jgi:serine/threonine protein kinase/tetratricopeptide (TPR) repeat protein
VPTQPSQEIEEELFAAAIALPDAERGAYLKRACSTNPGLIDRLIGLIDAFRKSETFVKEDAIRAWDSVDRIGSYQLMRELGEGGCGIAYLAEQTAPVKREVAVKVIKPGMDTKAVIARFEAERQALALMNHPNVARVFDAGATPEGRPYFVMELVRGIRITDYCAQSRLTIPERLSLFIQVCQAIQHAHQKGIIHRDIKPSNVLVTMHDGSPIAKVIDFGIAKATQGRLIEQTLHTEVGQIIGTPAYISPEQTEPAQAGVDTRSDIYSLGVLLYELLTSQTPFDPHELAQASIDQLRERLRTEEPPRPSRRLNSLDREMLTRISISAGTTASKLLQIVRDDLDWIVMQCLEKEPSRRYPSVSDLTADLNRYLRHEPVLARPPNLTYTLRKLARRNQLAFASAVAAAGLVIFITLFAITMTIQAQRIAAERDTADREKERAEKVSNVVLSVFAVVDPFQTFDGGVSGPAILEQAALSIERELRDQPAPRGRMLHAVGRAYVRRAEPKPGVHYLKEAVSLLSQTHGAESEALMAMIDLSVALNCCGEPRQARKAIVKADNFAQRHGLQRSTAYARLLLNRGRIEMGDARVADARASFESSLQLYRDVAGNRTSEVAEVLSELAMTFTWTDDLAQAERLAREAIAIYEITVPAMHPDRVSAETKLADILYLLNRLDEAALLFQGALQRQTRLFGTDSAIVADTLDSLAMVRYSQRRYGEAEALSQQAIATARVAFGGSHRAIGNMDVTLARTLIQVHKYEEAGIALREALKIFAETLPPDHQHIASAEYFLGEVLLAKRQLKEAEVVLTASLDRWKRSGAPSWRAMRSASALGEVLYREGRTLEGTRLLSDSFHQLVADPNAETAAKDKASARVARYLRTSWAKR